MEIFRFYSSKNNIQKSPPKKDEKDYSNSEKRLYDHLPSARLGGKAIGLYFENPRRNRGLVSVDGK